MTYVTKLLQNKNYLQLVRKLEDLEQDRCFCRHDFSHFMDVARLASLRNREAALGLEEELICLAALLHDLGRVREYEDGTSHDVAGKEIAFGLLKEISYPEKQTEMIVDAIGSHRGHGTVNDHDLSRDYAEGRGESSSLVDNAERKNAGSGKVLADLIKWTDKKVRPCFLCRAQAECKWGQEQRNSPENWK